MELKDPAAALAALESHRAAFARVWQECEPVARGRIRVQLPADDVEDAIQDVAVKLLTAFPKKQAEIRDALAGGNTFRMNWPAYTNATTRNLLIDLAEEREAL